MASNGLVANPKKTSLIILNHKQQKTNDAPITIEIGNEKITLHTEGDILVVCQAGCKCCNSNSDHKNYLPCRDFNP